jgi:hypothetical protein
MVRFIQSMTKTNMYGEKFLVLFLFYNSVFIFNMCNLPLVIKLSLSKNPFLSDYPHSDFKFPLFPLKSKLFPPQCRQGGGGGATRMRSASVSPCSDRRRQLLLRLCRFWVLFCFSVFSSVFVFFWAVFFAGVVFGLLWFRALVEGWFCTARS